MNSRLSPFTSCWKMDLVDLGAYNSNNFNRILVETEVSTLWFASPAVDGDHELPMAGFLVESQGELMLVRRYMEADRLTNRFQVLRLRVQQLDAYPVLHSWEEVPVPDLGGQMLFVARGCSRSYNTEDFRGMKDGVYFLADVEWFAEEWEEMDAEGRGRLARDAGIWVNPPGCTIPIFLMPNQLDDCFGHSSSFWLFPGCA
uniref:KIB1-4 beta-propeller domain-containing protein n=1 Tax=Setaria viridis TaxID=4556 RepID=A0A4V6D6D3_SETVI|nr:hypothetical protein SEVIR_5G132800v2 [Setaria viridis]